MTDFFILIFHCQENFNELPQNKGGSFYSKKYGRMTSGIHSRNAGIFQLKEFH